MTRSLRHLLASADGRALLEGRAVVSDPAAFAEMVASGAPTAPDGAATVYVAHQIQCDYRPSVVAKLEAARDLEPLGLGPEALWLDMDRIGSDRWATTIVLPGPPGEVSVRLVPQRLRHLEARFAGIDPDRVESAAAAMQEWATGRAGPGGRARADRAAAAMRGSSTLAEANHRLTRCVVAGALDYSPESTLVSELAAGGALTPVVEALVAAADDVVAVWNEALERFSGMDVDPGVGPLDDRWLPLHYSCPDGGRNRLVREDTRGDTFAVTSCRCGAQHRFHLGSTVRSAEALLETSRWSMDVTLPIALDRLFAGCVGGLSSAMYGLVLREVAGRVLGHAPIPMLVPDRLREELPEAPTLLHAFLEAA